VNWDTVSISERKLGRDGRMLRVRGVGFSLALVIPAPPRPPRPRPNFIPPALARLNGSSSSRP